MWRLGASGTKCLTRTASLLAALAATCASAADIDEIEITAFRLEDPAARRAFKTTRLLADDIANAPSARLDGVLTALPGVSLFRRAGSLSAHPTTQGLSLRGIGPNGAGRALVIRDGVPLNDPFGGWVFWSAIDPSSLGAVDILRGGGAGPYGNQALSGVVSLISRPISETGFSADARIGSFETYEVKGSAALAGEEIGLRLSARHFESGGFHPIGPDQRGPVDIRAASDSDAADAHLAIRLAPATRLQARFSWFEEDRINGLALSTNETDGLDASLSLIHDGGADRPSYELTGYWQRRDFANSFASVLDAARSQSRSVLDQFDVPAWGTGGRALLRLPLADRSTLEVGVDARRLSGETHELFRNLGQGFTRIRQAGGDQRLIGVWTEFSARPVENFELSGGVRFDRYKVFNGVISERDRASGALLRDERDGGQEGGLVNGRLAGRYHPTGALTLRAAGYSGWRLPTINEFYRPFRVGNDVTEANPLLERERVFGLEGGVLWQPLNTLSLSIDYFRNWLHDAVGNVTLALGSGVFPPAGFIPEGGSLRQRRNIDRVLNEGLEFEGKIALQGGFTLEAQYFLSGARIRRFDADPSLAGNRLAQSPRHSGRLLLGYRPDARTDISLALRYLGRQFEDDINDRRLPDALPVDLTLWRALRDGLSVKLALENIFDQSILSQISGDGLLSRAEPRLISLSLSLTI